MYVAAHLGRLRRPTCRRYALSTGYVNKQELSSVRQQAVAGTPTAFPQVGVARQCVSLIQFLQLSSVYNGQQDVPVQILVVARYEFHANVPDSEFWCPFLSLLVTHQRTPTFGFMTFPLLCWVFGFTTNWLVLSFGCCKYTFTVVQSWLSPLSFTGLLVAICQLFCHCAKPTNIVRQPVYMAHCANLKVGVHNKSMVYVAALLGRLRRPTCRRYALITGCENKQIYREMVQAGVG